MEPKVRSHICRYTIQNLAPVLAGWILCTIGEKAMRKIIMSVVTGLLVAGVWAGDVAHFVNLGFSPDGTRFVFAQHGTVDGTFQAYADIFCVDVAQNSFIPGGKFSTPPSAHTSGRDSVSVFSALKNDSSRFLKRVGVDGTNTGRPLYVKTDAVKDNSVLSFRDFETGADYQVSLHSRTEGAQATVRSSFHLQLSKTDANGIKTLKTLGLPDFRRTGVVSYSVRRVMTDSSGTSLVFVIEKEEFNAQGTSTRFMVETVRF